MKKIKILLSALVVIVLLAILLVVLNGVFSKDNDNNNDNNIEEKQPEQKELYKEPETKTKKLPAIKTKDKMIEIADTIAYYRDGISEIMLDIESNIEYPELYLTLEFRKDDQLIDTKVVYATNVKKDSEFQYIIQSTQDLTKTKKWSVSIVDYQSALNAGFQEVID